MTSTRNSWLNVQTGSEYMKCLSSQTIKIIWIKMIKSFMFYHITKILCTVQEKKVVSHSWWNFRMLWLSCITVCFKRFENIYNYRLCNLFLEMYDILIRYYAKIYKQGYLSLFTIWKKVETQISPGD